MKRIIAIGAVAALAAVTFAGTASAAGHEPPPHGHMLVQRPVIEVIQPDDDDPQLYVAVTSFRKCVDLAAGRSVPLNAHHAGIHTGSAGEALFDRAGHAVVPTAPLTPWANCAAFEAALPILLEPLPLGP